MSIAMISTPAEKQEEQSLSRDPGEIFSPEIIIEPST